MKSANLQQASKPLGWFGLTILVATWACQMATPAIAQSGRTNLSYEITNAIREFEQTVYLPIIQDHVLNNRPVAKEDVAIIRSLAAYQNARRYQGQMTPEQKAVYYVTEAFLDHFEGASDNDVMRWLGRAYSADRDHPDVNDAYITLALLHGDIEKAQEILAENNAGNAVVLDGQALDEWNQQRSHQYGLDRPATPSNATDPNKPTDPNRPADPNSTGKNNSKPSGTDKGSEPAVVGQSRWAQVKRAEQTEGAGRVEGSGYEGGYDPYGGAPVVRTPRPRPRPTASRSGAAEATPSPRATRRSQGQLKLPLDMMPYTYLGQKITDMNLLTLNGSWYVRPAESGQALCILLWMLPLEGVNRSTSIATTASYGFEYGYGEEGFYSPYSSAGVPTSAQEESAFPVQEVKTDLFENADQLRAWYRFYVPSGSVQFMSMNMDPGVPALVPAVSEVFIERPWPWLNCMAELGSNHGQLPFEGDLKYAMLLADPEGTIVYAGPVGGYLPRMLMDHVLPETHPATLVAAAPISGIPVMERPADSDMTDEASSETQSADSEKEEPSRPVSRTPTNRSATSPVDETEALVQETQIQRLMELARVERRLSPRNALKRYDEILETWPDSAAAGRVKVEIRAICRQHPNLEKEREQEGKYTGEG